MEVTIYVSREADDCRRLIEKIDLRGDGYRLKTVTRFHDLETRFRTSSPARSLFVVCPGGLPELAEMAGLQSETHPKSLVLILPEASGEALDSAYRCRPRVILDVRDNLPDIEAVLLRMIRARVGRNVVEETGNVR